jgi:membrane fusion protein (multidrug efflux system)
MFARVRIDLGTRKDSLQVPERAVVELQGKTFLWVITPENTASQRPVKVGELVNSKVSILEGLKPGERVVVEGLQKAREGAPVTPMTAAQMAAMQSAPAAEAKPAKH